MKRFRMIGRSLAIAVATVVLGTSTAHAVPAADDAATLDLLTEAIEALRAGDSNVYELAAEELASGGYWLPTMARTALADQDEDRLNLVWLALEGDDLDLLRQAMDTLAAERDAFLFGTVGDPESGRAVRRSDEENVAMLQILERRGIVVSESVATLMDLNRPGEGVRPPRPAVFDEAIGEIAAQVANNGILQIEPDTSANQVGGTDDGSQTPAASDDSLSLTMLLLLAVGAAGVASLAWTLRRRRKHEEMADLAFTDSLTGLNNRRRFDTDIEAMAKQGGQPTAMLMIDVDHFKSFNDTYGHSVGDQVLQLVANELSHNVRQHDVAYRYGGEEFCVLLPNANERDALATGERLRSAIVAIELPVSASVTVSVGVSIGPAIELEDTIERADAALFTAKDEGRNRVTLG